MLSGIRAAGWGNLMKGAKSDMLAEQAMTLLSGYDASVNAPEMLANYCVFSTIKTDLTPSLTLDRGIP